MGACMWPCAIGSASVRLRVRLYARASPPIQRRASQSLYIYQPGRSLAAARHSWSLPLVYCTDLTAQCSVSRTPCVEATAHPPSRQNPCQGALEPAYASIVSLHSRTSKHQAAPRELRLFWDEEMPAHFSPTNKQRQHLIGLTVYWTVITADGGGGGGSERMWPFRGSGRRPSGGAPTAGPRSQGPGSAPQTTGSDPRLTARTGAAPRPPLW
ncbi:hypothetical protein FJT64_023144 [Amphibalanus amphitrite]|uniref:Uncharacterized protein n=1 Tax=Amphibalanus amphitrite TaxID=1232801 RepID=A0A6A4WBS8_AMPAM|nr:hypothetical protein FJT64_023144 [Amphibalanus amphitrite]